MKRVALIALLLAVPASAQEFSREDGIAMIEAAAKRTLRDPDSARFEWPYTFIQGWYKRPFRKKAEGWITCGTMNAKNAYGGYAGPAPILGVIKDGEVVAVDFDDLSARYGRYVTEACKKYGTPV